MSQPTTTILTAGRRRKRSQLGNGDSRSPSPEHYIDLTVDTPVSTRQRKQSSTNKSDSAGNVTANLNDTIVIDDNDSPVSRPSRPARQRKLTGLRCTVINNDTNMSTSSAGASVSAATAAAGTTSPSEVIGLKDHDMKDQTEEKSKIQRNDLHNESVTVLSCPICFEELMNSSLKPMSTKCGHIFCENCIQSSLSARKKCPVCMAPATLKSCIRLHL
ncbi:E3 ubiquitin-protein ligase RNF4-like [Microplitis mediator]|uniref:E3 ubiquitin-protein ligase RNF4-like n=1 Tax=Microplitis mediator TaxID=375433 RepID=UPI0025522A78|nr:E3 ubiquitin-protein ligase RNF4-like [Microplitis mediator]